MSSTSTARPSVTLVIVFVVIALVVGALAGWGASALGRPATLASTAKLGCVDPAAKTLTLISPDQHCASSLLPVTWQTAAAKDGAPGATGPAGKVGTAGTAGATGATGPAGATGATGAKGDTGKRGATGAASAQGAKGDTGEQGAPGAKGDTGEQGETGPQGEPGAQGETGPQGEPGLAAWTAVTAWSATGTYTPGPPASVVTYQGGAYVAVASSIGQPPSAVSTFWVQIAAPGQIGEQGPPGAQGDTGAQGEPGLPGEAGLPGEPGADGANGGTGPQGEKGDTGPAGPIGPQGPAGDSTFSTKFGTTQSPAAAGGGTACTIGQIMLTAANVGNGIPADGRTLQIDDNEVLYTLLGVNFGGNGTTTFNLPDLRALAPNGLTYMICVNGVYPSRS